MSKDKVIIDLCSSDEEQEEYDLSSDEENDYIPKELNESSLRGDDSDWSRHDDDATDSEIEFVTETKGDDDDDDDDVDDKVTRLLTAGSDLKKSLNVKECKAYLRKHGLRLSGTKAVFIQRIIEHCRIRDGSGQALYPRSSFAINCKGDVCKGDTVLFTQKLHHKYEKMKRSGKIMGRRTVAGQVVKESYGTSKQQHTFTIEVLWCEGIRKLPPLFPLLVKGRNLYRLMTLRQRWANEEDRVKVLSEKHSRGAAARKVMRERKRKSGYVLKDGRLQKPGHVKKTRKNEKDENQTKRVLQDIPANHSSQGHKNPSQRPPFNVHHSHLPLPSFSPSQSYAPSTHQNQWNQPAFYNGMCTPNDLPGHASFNPHANTHATPVTHQTSSKSGYNHWVRGLDRSHRRGGDIDRQGDALAGHTRTIMSTTMDQVT